MDERQPKFLLYIVVISLLNYKGIRDGTQKPWGSFVRHVQVYHTVTCLIISSKKLFTSKSDINTYFRHIRSDIHKKS